MTWKVNPWIIAAGAALLFLAAGGYYTYQLRAKNAELQQERDYQKQRAIAAKDSLKKLRSSRGLEWWGRALSPSRNIDTLREDSEGDVSSTTQTELDPEPADTAGTVVPDSTRPDGTHVYKLKEKIGPYDLSGNLDVFPPGDRIRYDVTVDMRPFKVEFYRTDTRGVRKLRIGLPPTVRPIAGQGYYDASREAGPRSPWQLHAPLAATRIGLSGNFGVGARVQRSLSLPFGIDATASVGLLVSPAAMRQRTGSMFSPEVELYLGF